MILDEIGAEHVGIAARSALAEARLAAAAGSFAVGACLITRDGRILARARNRVAGGESKRDPTAHAERRLLNWYYSRRFAGRTLPRETDVAIVGTVEPCMMCAGAMLSAGIASLSLCEDAAAGVGIARGHDCLPDSLRVEAHVRMRLLSDSRIDAPASAVELVGEAESLFATTLASVRSSVRRDALRTVQTVAFGQDGTWQTAHAQASARGVQIAGVRIGAMAPIMAHARNPDSPIGYPALELIRTIARRGLVGSFESVERGALQFVLAGEFESDAAAVTSLGAIGSFAEGSVERSPYIVMQGVSEAAFRRTEETLARFPSFYREVIGLTLGYED